MVIPNFKPLGPMSVNHIVQVAARKYIRVAFPSSLVTLAKQHLLIFYSILLSQLF